MKLIPILVASLLLGGCVVRPRPGTHAHRRSGHPASDHHEHCHDRGGKHHKRVCHSHPHGPNHH